jgi:thiol-disulfide isomerase/thioredoxin
MSRLMLGLLSLALVAPVRAADDEEDLRSLAKEFNKAASPVVFKARAAETDDERAQAMGEFRQLTHRYAPRFLALAEKKGADADVTFDAAAWVVGNAPKSPEAARAVDLLVKNHIGNKKMGSLLSAAARSLYPSSEKLLRAVRAGADTPERQGRAAFFLAQHLKMKHEEVQQLNQADDLGFKKRLEALHGKELVRQLADLDPVKIRKECETLLEEVGQKHGDVKQGSTTLGKLVEPELFEVRRLAVGKTVPDISGEDLDGKRFNLSDYRGKVVVMVFWGTWCPPCRAMLPHEKEFVKKMEKKPFALIGMNSDTDTDALKKFLDKEKITWRQIPEGGTSGPIATQWNVNSWPTVFVVDARGVIRSKNVRNERLEEVIEKLVKEAERK